MLLLTAEPIETSNTTVDVPKNSGVPTTRIVIILVVLTILIMLMSTITAVCLYWHGKTPLPLIAI